MADEFQESDLLFSEHNSTGDHSDSDSDSDSREPSTDHYMLKRLENNNTINSSRNNSAPVNISGGISWIQYSFDHDYDYGDGEMVPPHVIIGRRVAGKMAFSLCSGNGRTLKGRDLSQVRNSILKMTGFLES